MYKCQLKSQNAFISYASSYVWNFKSNWEYGSSQSWTPTLINSSRAQSDFHNEEMWDRVQGD